MFGYFDLFVVITITLILVVRYILCEYRDSKKIKLIAGKTGKLVNEVKLATFYKVAYNCCKCKVAVTMVIGVPTSWASGMGILSKKRKVKYRLCDKCFYYFKEYISKGFDDFISPSNENPVVAFILISKFLEGGYRFYLSELMSEYDRFDKELKEVVRTIYDKNYEGDIFAVFEEGSRLL
jgi:hypothetical protein